MPDIVTKEHLELAGICRSMLFDYRDAEDLISIGAYVKGSSAKIDYAMERIDELNGFLKQEIDNTTAFDQSLKSLNDIVAGPKKDEEV